VNYTTSFLNVNLAVSVMMVTENYICAQIALAALIPAQLNRMLNYGC